jgi:hypothetical protein
MTGRLASVDVEGYECMDRTSVRWAMLLGGLALALIIGLTFGPLPQWILQYVHPEYRRLTIVERLSAETSLRSQLLQAVGGLLLIVGAVATWRQVVTASSQLALNRATRLTSAFTSALEQLEASNSLARRVGGIYALDRVANDDPAEGGRVAEVLAAFVRQVPAQPIERVPADVQAALDILLKLRQGRRLNLDEARLRGAILTGTDLSGLSLRRAVLVGANLSGSNLSGADLSGADLRDANLSDADLLHTNLTGADLRNTNLREARNSTLPLT